MGRPFNLTNFNTGGGNPQYTNNYFMAQAFQANCDPRVMISPGFIFNQNFAAEAALGWGYDIQFEFSQAFAASASMEISWAPRYSMAQTVEAEASMALHLVPLIKFAQSFAVTAQLKVMIYFSLAASQSFISNASGKIWICPAYGVMYQLFQAVISAVPVESHEAIIGITIQPGGILVIDADNYTAYLDNVSVIDRVSGEWLSIRRPLHRIDVSGGTSGDLDVTLLYRELFL